MAKLPDCQFIQIKVDNKVISGSSEEDNYKNWMEGYSPLEGLIYSGVDGVYFTGVNAAILTTKETSELYEKYLIRGYKDITITIVHRGSDKLNQNYEIHRSVYDQCKIHSLGIEVKDGLAFMKIHFTFEGTMEVTLNVPNQKGDALEKIGPIKYCQTKKRIV